MTRRSVLTAAAAVAIGATGVGAGAGLYAAIGPQTRTVVETVPADGSAQPAAMRSESSIGAVYGRTYRSVVDITVTSDQTFTPFGGGHSQAEGSGFVYDGRGNIVTNQHVVAGASAISVTFWNGKTYKARVVGDDSSTDLAVIRVTAPSSVLFPLALGDSSKTAVGDTVIAIGSPFGLSGTVTSGIVSALGRSMQAPNRYRIANAIQTDAPINHGNSGGPLINAGGEAIGVVSQIQSASGGSDGVGFAVPSNTVGAVVSQIVAGKAVAHAYLGISVAAPASGRGAGVAQVVEVLDRERRVAIPARGARRRTRCITSRMH